mmetsp:Transcript_4511/g.10622  ORF Transcript_4511/g.10622 Transcript_4511/m.10622 type:complete len:308 (+) Transcript_4511:184-1107(+)|eukprot:CAMPEP_0172638736 /NCGR_PEP_ID=MMETSP1068-20121228/215233_1 /TAXON_ID=35684 /ORGANISM="Pseudopedinella elastica, Strain CCMP716" /LENGTH=307 /DNA_ID=CAMNT_0013451693 /DNA_START=25 /DNA_END=948 /DNA_ORIENTATION=+
MSKMDDYSSSKLRALTDAELAEALKNVLGNANLPRRRVPLPPVLSPKQKMSEKLREIQSYISSLEYNHTGVSYVRMRKDRGAHHVLVTAKELIREALPIQCVEAVFIGLYLLDGEDILSFPLSFKSRVAGQVYRHIVLVVVHAGKYGALGISRCPQLMDKKLKFKSMADIIREYETCYEAVDHELLRVYIGLPFSPDAQPTGMIQWKAIRLSMSKPWTDIEEAANRFAKQGPKLTKYHNRTGELPDECKPWSSDGAEDGADEEVGSGAADDEGDNKSDASDDGGISREAPIGSTPTSPISRNRVFGV